ncbi:MAG TPA: hypothetical protein VF188_09610 [Longimicrobiales bacterium]
MMIVRQYGAVIHSVEPSFDARAMTEIGFRRAGTFSMPAAEFFEVFERVTEHALTASAEGDVKDAAEQALLASLLEDLRALEARLGPDEVLLVESRPGHDYPKTRDRTRTVVVGGIENRLHFSWTVEPPLRLGVYRRRRG